MKKVDMGTWERKEHFEFFQHRERPQVAITANVDVTGFYVERKKGLKEHKLSVCLYYAALSVVNGIKEFKYRIVDREVLCYDTIDAAFTHIPKGRTLHANCTAPFDNNFPLFAENCSTAMKKADQTPPLLSEEGAKQSLVYLSILPTIAFSSLTNPWGDPWKDTVPRIIFGKIHEESGRFLLPICVEALHSFIDGIHLAAFFEQFETLLKTFPRHTKNENSPYR